MNTSGETPNEVGATSRPSIGGDALGTATDVAGGTKLEVEPGQILAAGKLVSDQADALTDVLMQYGSTMRVGPPSENAISTALADAWNDAIVDGDESHLARAQAYLKGLRSLQAQLRGAAERYQLDDGDVAKTFGDRGAH